MDWKSPIMLNSTSGCSDGATTSEESGAGEEARSIWGPNDAKTGSGVSSDGSVVAVEDSTGGQGSVTS